MFDFINLNTIQFLIKSSLLEKTIIKENNSETESFSIIETNLWQLKFNQERTIRTRDLYIVVSILIMMKSQ